MPTDSIFYNGHIVLKYTAHFVYIPLNSYVYIHWILDFKYILLLYQSILDNHEAHQTNLQEDLNQIQSWSVIM